MNRLMHALLTIAAFLLLLSATACKKDLTGNNTNDPDTNTPAPIGLPVGDMYTEFIGPEGGTAKSPDGRIEITIPEGALTQETEIGIEPIKNTSPGGIGRSYRLTPHGNIFKKQVTVKFFYESDEAMISSAKALEIAYQNSKGVWTRIKGSVNDPINKTISVKTDHFSDWSYIASLELSPTVKTIGLGETATLVVFENVRQDNINDLIVPLPLEEPYIVKWVLHGPGKLEPKGNQAIYTAPSTKPSSNTATITVELNVKGKQVLLISTIYIIDEGITISINGGDWHTYPARGNKVQELNKYSIGTYLTGSNLPVISFSWPINGKANSSGLYLWEMLSDDDKEVAFHYTLPGLKQIYSAVYEDQDNDTHNSGGFLDVKEMEQNGKKYITGMFLIRKAGLYSVSTAEQINTGNITGTFKVQRNW